LKTILLLALNDLKRDAKRPWSIVLFTCIPIVLSLLIASVFKGGPANMPTVHVAVMDQDKDLISRVLRSFPTQGDAAKHLQLHFVENRQEGFRLVEKRKASAFLVLPKNLTVSLLEGRTNSVELYENPAEQVLPKIIRQATSLLTLGLSGAAELLGQPLRDARKVMLSSDFPAAATIGQIASDSTKQLGGLRTYLFPPLIQFKTIPSAEFEISQPRETPKEGRP